MSEPGEPAEISTNIHDLRATPLPVQPSESKGDDSSLQTPERKPKAFHDILFSKTESSIRKDIMDDLKAGDLYYELAKDINVIALGQCPWTSSCLPFYQNDLGNQRCLAYRTTLKSSKIYPRVMILSQSRISRWYDS